MALTQGQVIQRARTLVQESGHAALLTSADDYVRIFDLALAQFSMDRPNARVVHHTVTAAGFRYTLAGSGALAGLAGVDAWVPGSSYVRRVFHPYDTTSQANAPLESDEWRVTEEPAATVLELTTLAPSSGVLRLEFVSPHRLDAIAATVPAPSAPTLALVGSAGNLSAGVYQYAIVHRTANGATIPSATASVTVTTPASAGQVTVSITVPTVEGVETVEIYRTTAGGSQLKLVAALASPTLDSYTDNLADGSLGANAPTTNTAGGLSTVRQGDEQALVVLTASMVAQAVATRYVQNTGTTSLPGDVVNRNSQSEDMARRAKDLRAAYDRMIGAGAGAGAGAGGASGAQSAASTTKEFDLEPAHGAGFFFRPRRFR